MKSILPLLLCLPCAVSCVIIKNNCPQCATHSKEAVIAAEQKWLTAAFHLDTNTLDQLEADEFMSITPSAVLDKSKQLETIRHRPQFPATAAKQQPFTLSSQIIRVYGDTATVADLCTAAQGHGGTNSSSVTFIQTEVWHKQNKEWRIVHHHMSTFNPPRAQ